MAKPSIKDLLANGRNLFETPAVADSTRVGEQKGVNSKHIKDIYKDWKQANKDQMKAEWDNLGKSPEDIDWELLASTGMRFIGSNAPLNGGGFAGRVVDASKINAVNDIAGNPLMIAAQKSINGPTSIAKLPVDKIGTFPIHKAAMQLQAPRQLKLLGHSAINAPALQSNVKIIPKHKLDNPLVVAKNYEQPQYDEREFKRGVSEEIEAQLGREVPYNTNYSDLEYELANVGDIARERTGIEIDKMLKPSVYNVISKLPKSFDFNTLKNSLKVLKKAEINALNLDGISLPSLELLESS